jgi:hypothetical protein
MKKCDGKEGEKPGFNCRKAGATAKAPTGDSLV